ncbi:MAG: EpsI family protein [Azoarcus sp.]|nr:EpsI family protein [Azoarcus sp.]
MKSISLITAIALTLIMVLTLILGEHFKPTLKLADLRSKVDLESILPDRFENWSRIESAPAAIINPQSSVLLDKLYSQVVNRVYVNTAGDRVMISVAYGEDQRGGLQAHKPDFCYPAQGFSVTSTRKGSLQTPYGDIPVVRMETNAGSRFEPLTYWTTVGGVAISGGLQRKLVEIEYGIKGVIPDGVIFRLSSIGQDSEQAFEAQRMFVAALLSVLHPADRARLAGVALAGVSQSQGPRIVQAKNT